MGQMRNEDSERFCLGRGKGCSREVRSRRLASERIGQIKGKARGKIESKCELGKQKHKTTKEFPGVRANSMNNKQFLLIYFDYNEAHSILTYRISHGILKQCRILCSGQKFLFATILLYMIIIGKHICRTPSQSRRTYEKRNWFFSSLEVKETLHQ